MKFSIPLNAVPAVAYSVVACAVLAACASTSWAAPPVERGSVSTALWVELDAFDAAPLITEDTQLRAAGFLDLRNGESRPLGVGPLPDDLAWETLADGRARWTAVISSPDAYGLRLHFADLDLPAGAHIWLRHPKDATFDQGPITGAGYFGRGDMWSTVIPGESVQVEVTLPAGAPLETAFTITDLMHIYRDLRDPLVTRESSTSTREGSCHEDVNCEPAWAPVKDAVGRIFTIINSSQSICGGTLLRTAADDLTPIFLTANHCAPNQMSAETTVVYWFYETDACDGVVPALSSVPTTTYADLLATEPLNNGNGYDYTLLMLQGTLPSGLTFADWDLDAAAAPTPVVCIHHPTGAYKRIMFGTRNSVFGFPTKYYPVSWNSGGTVEFSTSGSPLFRESTQTVIGHASFAASTPVNCTNTVGPFGYGKLSGYFTQVSAFLENGADDPYDAVPGSGDACTSPIAINPDSFAETGLVVKSLDEDWFLFTIAPDAGYAIDLTFTHAWGDVDLEVYDGCGGGVLASATSTDDNESLTIDNCGGASTLVVWIRIFLKDDTRATYDMTITSLAEPCGTAANPPCVDPNGGVRDFDDDNDIDSTDLSILLTNFGAPSGMTAADGDTDGDGDVDSTDLSRMLTFFGATCP